VRPKKNGFVAGRLDGDWNHRDWLRERQAEQKVRGEGSERRRSVLGVVRTMTRESTPRGLGNKSSGKSASLSCGRRLLRGSRQRRPAA
jgi:hypothetical protein